MRHFATVIALISVVSSPAVRAADVLLQPPPPVRRQGLPGRLQRPLCPELQRTIRAAVGGSTAPWSISVLMIAVSY